MKKIFYLSTCNTCMRILKEWGDVSAFHLQDVKTSPIIAEELDHLKSFSGSYESLFNRRSMKYRSMGLKSKTLSEEEYRSLILQEYTFLKRPILVMENQIFIGNAKKVVQAAKDAISKEANN